MIGGEVTVGQCIGAKKIKRASAFASHTTTFALVIGCLWTFFLFVFAPEVLSYYRLEKEITDMAVLYLRIVCFCLPFQFLTYNFAGIFNGAGRSIVPFRNYAIGLLLNMLIDPILMFACGLGLYGAAIGMMVSQIFVFGLFFYQIHVANKMFRNFRFIVKPRWIFLRRIIFLGAPVSAMNFIYATINITLARIASTFGGHLGLMTQTTGGQIEGVTWNTSQGFSTALSAFTAQNYAAGKLDRAKKAYHYTLQVMTVFGVAITLLFLLFGGAIFGIIVPEENAMAAGAVYLSIVGFTQIFMMFELTTQGMFNGIGRTVEPAVISITFNALRIPLAFFLASRMGVVGVWWAIAISSVCKGVILPVWFTIISRQMEKRNRMKII